MSEPNVIQLAGVGKMYKIFPSRLDHFLVALGLSQLMPWRRIEAHEFWALRNIDFELKAGKRLGIIGRNGAGKSTLLKLITGNLAPTEGHVTVHGNVQALLEAGAGFHPEFTGYENVHAALTYQGLTGTEIERATEDIAEFTELGDFLRQPYKTYSTGMMARLIFAVATSVKPKILIIDEILGAGDAYFFSKSMERMKRLVLESGASVLLVSHSLGHILQFCDETIWIERGRIMKRGNSMEVVNAYDGFIRTLDERRIRGKNSKLRSRTVPSFLLDQYGDTVSFIFTLQGPVGSTADISNVQLLRNDQIEDEIRIGDVQDSTTAFPAFILVDNSHWSKPARDNGVHFRSLTVSGETSSAATGQGVFYLYDLATDATYHLRARYRHGPAARLAVTVVKNGEVIYNQQELPDSSSGWNESELALSLVSTAEPGRSLAGTSTGEPAVEPSQDGSPSGNGSLRNPEPITRTAPAVRWPSEGSITIEKVSTLGEDGREQAVMTAGSTMTICVSLLAHRDGQFDCVPSVTLQRLDGVLISNFIGHAIPLKLVRGERKTARVTIPRLLFGDGEYRLSSSLFEKTVSESSRYDLIVHGCEFKVTGNDSLVSGFVVQHPTSEWVIY
jgi:lipopolysaccharide transport system ATP-binding protein